MDCDGSVSCCHLPQGSSLDHRSPCPPAPMSMERDNPVQTGAWHQPHGRSPCEPSLDASERYPPAWSFHLWWILWNISGLFLLLLKLVRSMKGITNQFKDIVLWIKMSWESSIMLHEIDIMIVEQLFADDNLIFLLQFRVVLLLL